MTVIGLGEAGCNLAEKFEGNERYKVKLIDVDIEGDNCFSLQKQNTPEQYEKTFPDISNFLSDVDEYVFDVSEVRSYLGVDNISSTWELTYTH